MNIVGLTVVLISVVLMGLVHTQDRAIISSKGGAKEILKERANFDIIAANIKSQILHPTVLERTIDANIPSSCQNNVSLNCERNYRVVNVLRFFNSADDIDTRIHGFDNKGKKCRLSEPECVVRVSLVWQADEFECIGTCSAVKGILMGRYVSNNRGLALNLDNYSFQIKVNMPSPSLSRSE